jgi:hypothetical protein
MQASQVSSAGGGVACMPVGVGSPVHPPPAWQVSAIWDLARHRQYSVAGDLWGRLGLRPLR